jgi:hypothetical protein
MDIGSKIKEKSTKKGSIINICYTSIEGLERLTQIEIEEK